MSTKYPTPVVAAAIFNAEGKILLTKRSAKVRVPHTWCLPGGHFEGGTTWATSMHDEVREEVGLTVRSEKLYGIYSDPKFHVLEIEGETRHYVAAAFIAECEGEVRINDESEEWGWFGEHELPAPLLQTELPKIRDAFAFRGTVFLR